MARTIVFLSDFGLDDEFVGICHGVLARSSPDSRIIDLAHGVPPHGVLRGALLLARSVAYMPADSVYLAVVDPGVGGTRRPVAVRTASGAALVAPDNGLASLAWPALGGVEDAVEITAAEVRLMPHSTTFHGRDVFAPAAAWLAAGRPFERLGRAVDPASLEVVAVPEAETGEGVLRCRVLSLDRFGNVELAATGADLGSAGLDRAPVVALEAGDRTVHLPRAAAYSDVLDGAALLVVDSSGWLTISVNRGSAAERFGLGPGATVVLRRPAGPAG